MQAAALDSLPLLRMLIEFKAELNAVHPDADWTAFHTACDKGSADCAEALVRAGCDTSLRSKGGRTGRDVAQQKGHAAVLERLAALEKGSQPPATHAASPK